MRIRNQRRVGYTGTLDLSSPTAQALAAITPTITFSTNLTPPLVIDLTGGGGGSPSGLASLLQPTLTLNTPVGGIVVAPFGPAVAGSSLGLWTTLVGLGFAAVIGAGFWWGYTSK